MLRNSFGYSLRRHQPDPIGYQKLTARLADGRPSTCLLRGHLSDLVDLHLRGETLNEPTRWGIRTLELAMLALGAVIVIVEPDGAEIEEKALPIQWSAAGGRRVQAAYAAGWQRLLWATRIPVVRARCNALVRNGRATRRLTSLVQEQHQIERRAARFVPPSLGIGSLTPRYLVIGEGPAPSPCWMATTGDVPDLPFSRGPASELLWRAVDELELRWQEGFWVNASTFGARTPWGSESIPRPSEKILCLGDQANQLARTWYGERHAHLLAMSDRWRTVTHPSHVLRFARHEYTSWRNGIGRFLADSVTGENCLAHQGEADATLSLFGEEELWSK